MSTPHSIHHQFLRPSILHILRAAGFHSTKPSVLDAITDMAARYMTMLASQAASHALTTHEDTLELRIEDVRMAMQNCGVLGPEKVMEDQAFGMDEDQEDMRGVKAFIEWATSKPNKEIRRVGLEGGDEVAEDYLTVLKKKNDKTEDLSKYNNSIFGKGQPIRQIPIEGSEVASIEEWVSRLHNKPVKRASESEESDLSSIGDQSMADPESD